MFKTTDEFSDIVGELNPNFNFTRLLQSVETAELEYIRPVIGGEFYELCKARIDAEVGTETEKKFFDLLKKALAYYSYAKLLFRTMITTSQTGSHEIRPKETEPMRQWIALRNENEMIETADRFLDQCLLFLEHNKKHFPIWAVSSYASETNQYLVNSVSDFEEFEPIGGSRRAFLIVRYQIDQIETLTLRPLLGEEFFAELKKMVLQKTFITPQHETLVKLLRSYLCTAALSNSLARLHININLNGLVLNRINNGVKSSDPANAQQVQYLIDNLTQRKSLFLSEVKNFLLQKSSFFPLCAFKPSAPKNRDNGGIFSF